VDKPWAIDLIPEDLPGDLRLVATHCGVDVALSLADKMGGVHLYITKAENALMPRKKKYVVEHFTGNNHRDLALATGLSEREVYKILAATQEDKRQEALFPKD